MTAINITSVLFALVAAVLWFLSTYVETPSSFTIYIVRPHEEPFGSNYFDGTYNGQGYSEDLISLARALKRQSKLSAWVAICTALSVLLQTVPVLFTFY